MAQTLRLKSLVGGRTPPHGTGPQGTNSRWITPFDWCAFNAPDEERNAPPTWDATNDEICNVVHRDIVSNPVVLRDYQNEAVRAAIPRPNFFVSGTQVVFCGGGKTIILSELIRRSRATAFVLTPGRIDQQQIVEVLKNTAGLTNVLEDVKNGWKFSDPLPDAVVTTYHTLVRAVKAVQKHRSLVLNNEPSGDRIEYSIIFMLMCRRFGVLVLDEVHTAVADHFVKACFLRASVVLGMSGSTVARSSSKSSECTDCQRKRSSSQYTPGGTSATLYCWSPAMVMGRSIFWRGTRPAASASLLGPLSDTCSGSLKRARSVPWARERWCSGRTIAG